MIKYVLILITLITLSACSSESNSTKEIIPNKKNSTIVDDPNDVPSESIVEPEETDLIVTPK